MASTFEKNRQILAKLHDPLRSNDHFGPTEQVPPRLFEDTSTPPSRRPKAQGKSDMEWAAKRAIIEELYIANDMKLEEVIVALDEEHDFHASLKQYKTKLKEWGLEKNIKDKDMRAIVRKDLKRKAENPSKPTKFRLRKRPVPPEKIERYKKAHSNCNEIIVADAPTPSEISYQTHSSYALSHTQSALSGCSVLGLVPSQTHPKSPQHALPSSESKAETPVAADSPTRTGYLESTKPSIEEAPTSVAPSSNDSSICPSDLYLCETQASRSGEVLKMLITELRLHGLLEALAKPRQLSDRSTIATDGSLAEGIQRHIARWHVGNVSGTLPRFLEMFDKHHRGMQAAVFDFYWVSMLAKWHFLQLQDIHHDRVNARKGNFPNNDGRSHIEVAETHSRSLSLFGQLAAFLSDVYVAKTVADPDLVDRGICPYIASTERLANVINSFRDALGCCYYNCWKCETVLSTLAINVCVEGFRLYVLEVVAHWTCDHSLHDAWYVGMKEKAKTWLGRIGVTDNLHELYGATIISDRAFYRQVVNTFESREYSQLIHKKEPVVEDSSGESDQDDPNKSLLSREQVVEDYLAMGQFEFSAPLPWRSCYYSL